MKSTIETLTPVKVVPQNDRLQRYSIVCVNEKRCPGTGKEVIAENIRTLETALRIAACLNAMHGIPSEDPLLSRKRARNEPSLGTVLAELKSGTAEQEVAGCGDK